MTYTTEQGDTWDLIAYKQLGSEIHMPALIRANLDHVDTVIFSAGVVLTLPVVAEEIATTLPPWKREG